ncbi:MAG TPA: hypothetical protein PLG32_16215 [Piscinibacter sp.]|nr:hypothetical protein [Piscinibacter sp.]
MATNLRIKAHWFKAEQPKSPEQTASAMAFIAWRVAINMLKRMREAGFDIDAGPAYFGFVREVLVFLLCGIDRMAYAQLGADARTPFTTALVLRVAEILRENEADLLGPVEGDDYRERFIDQFNALSSHYAEFGWSEPDGPDFAFVRYLGSRLEATVPEKDRHWVIDQVMAAEVPEAVGMLQRAMQGVFSTEPRSARRGALSGD